MRRILPHVQLIGKSKMVFIKFFGGVNEIGGNKILVEDIDTKIFLDFGISFKKRRKFFQDPYLRPKKINDLIKLGVVPSLKGVYKTDQTEKSVDAIFISHAHSDHSGYLSLIKREIPVYCNPTTETMLKTLNEIRVKTFENDFNGITFKRFRSGEKISVGSIEVEPIHVDHSVPGAYGFLIHTSEGTIAYSGDFRMHGPLSKMTLEFIERSSSASPTVLIAEGTNLMGSEVLTEKDVEESVKTIVNKTCGLVLAQFSSMDIDRLKTFLKAMDESRRKLVVPLGTAYLLSRLSQDKKLRLPEPAEMEKVFAYVKSKERYRKWELRTMDFLQEKDKLISSSELEKRQRNFVVMLPMFSVNELMSLNPVSGSCYILSSSEPFNEEQIIEFEKFTHWLNVFGLPLFNAHVSGHMRPDQLREMIKEIKPKKFIPVHTENPELYIKYVSGTVKETILPSEGGTVEI